jgi:hypothetical protein
MQRRSVLAAVGSALCVGSAGCQSQESEPTAAIHHVELENHRRNESREFDVRIERDGETVFDESASLEAAGSGNSTAVFERPVDGPDAYNVTVRTGDYEAAVELDDWISADTECLGLVFYMGAATLHWERREYTTC